MRSIELLLGEEFLERPLQYLDHGAAFGHQRVGLAVARQVDQDHLTVRGELVEHRVPPLAAMTDPMNQHERLAGTDAFEG